MHMPPRPVDWSFTKFLLAAIVAAALSGPGPARAGDVPKVGYETGLENIRKIAGELHVALDPKSQKAVEATPHYVESIKTPCIAPVEIQAGPQAQKTVEISAGFIDLINALSHAKALSESGNDYLKSYAARLASANDNLPAVTEGLSAEKAWGFDTMNAQAGQFNQMAGALLAIDLAHHYLGHYKKYSAQLAMSGSAGAPPPPISQLVTEKEWRDAVLKGAKNALDCGLGVDGLKNVFDCMEAMPSRPAWSAYIVPPKVNLSKLNKDLQRLENDFFLVEK
jgi:hypothetical protein